MAARLSSAAGARDSDLIESAKLNSHDPWAYIKDVLERRSTLKQRDIAELLLHNWRPPHAIPTFAAMSTATPTA